MRQIYRIAGVVAVALALSAGSALGQTPSLELTPYVGVFVPTNDLVDVPSIDLTVKQEAGLALGARLTYGLPGAWAIEGGFLYALSDNESDDAGDVVGTDANVWAGSGRLLYRIGVPLAPISVHLGGGLAVFGRGGDAYGEAEGTTDFGGVVGVGATLDLPILLKIRADVEDYIYSVALSGGEEDEEFDSRLQNDLVVSIGVVLGLGGR
jgi:hypothetical protein